MSENTEKIVIEKLKPYKITLISDKGYLTLCSYKIYLIILFIAVIQQKSRLVNTRRENLLIF